MESPPAQTSARWFSANPGKAWAERLFLIYSPVWIAAVALVQLTGWMKTWSDPAYLAFGLATMAPLVAWPLLRPAEVDRGTPIHRRYWFRFNVWIGIFVWIGSYFFTNYFFDVLGMEYRFPTEWNLGAALVGSGEQKIPFFLYPLTQAYFVTYHVAMVVVLRFLRTRFRLGGIGFALCLVVLAYAVAFAETFFMANELLADYFWYADRGRMLLYGSIFYACFFVVSTPLVYHLDEPDEAGEIRERTLGRVALEALAAGMIVFILLDGWTLVIGRL